MKLINLRLNDKKQNLLIQIDRKKLMEKFNVNSALYLIIMFRSNYNDETY